MLRQNRLWPSPEDERDWQLQGCYASVKKLRNWYAERNQRSNRHSCDVILAELVDLMTKAGFHGDYSAPEEE